MIMMYKVVIKQLTSMKLAIKTKQFTCDSSIQYIDGLVLERRNYIADALELCLSCTNPSKIRNV